jgi:hypothetical protein
MAVDNSYGVYSGVTEGYIIQNQGNTPWAQTFRMTIQAPAIANRIFDTKAHAEAFINDSATTASAVVGLVLSVIGDSDEGNNCIWRVKSVYNPTTHALGELEKVGTSLPAKQHELIYSDDDKTHVTKQLMYEEGIVVDNPTDLAFCKGQNDFSFLEVKDTWPTEVISDTTSAISSEGMLEPGGITVPSNAFWYYNETEHTLDAKFNDNSYSRLAFLHDPSGVTDMYHDALYGFYDNISTNDTIGCSFIGFGTTPIQREGDAAPWLPTVTLTFNIDPKYKNDTFTACNMGFGVRKRKVTWTDKRSKYVDRTAPYGFGIIGSSGSEVVSGTSVEYGKCVVKNTSLINQLWHSPYYGPSYVRVVTEKKGGVITWTFSQIVTSPTTIPDLINGTKVQIDLVNYKVRYIQASLSGWKEFTVGDEYHQFFDILRNDAHFAFHQSSTEYGRVYNVSLIDHRLILDIDTEQVWKNTAGTWSIETGKYPRELFTGSRLNYNDKTKKLWYSSGRQIYEIGSSGATPIDVSGYLPLSGGTMTGTILAEDTGTAPDIGSSSAPFGNMYAGAFYQTSDRNKKDIISPISLEKAYEAICGCNAVLYTLKDDITKREQIGLIAQEVEKFFPELVMTDENGVKSLDYARLTVLTFSVLKDLIGRVNALENKTV